VAEAREAVARVAQRRVLLVHQSVGQDLLDGLLLLAGAEGQPLRVVELSPAVRAVASGTLGHIRLGHQGDPERSLSAFAAAVDGLAAPGVEVALLEPGHADFTPGTDGAALAARYLSTLAELERRHPATAFVAITAPLTAPPAGARERLRQLAGRPPAGALENERREAFNAALRAAGLGAGRLFDLALVESIGRDGRVETTSWQGRTAPALVRAYTHDGGRLNREGRFRAARALLAVLVEAMPRPGIDGP
jgi:hypothetical protein